MFEGRLRLFLVWLCAALFLLPVSMVVAQEKDGVADLKTEPVTGQPVLQIQIKQDEIARYGVPAKAVLDLVESVGSKPLGEVVDGPYRFPLVVSETSNVRRRILRPTSKPTTVVSSGICSTT